MQNLIAAVDDLTFPGQEDVLAPQQEDLTVAALRTSVAVELQINRRRRWWRRRAWVRYWRNNRVRDVWRRRLGAEDVTAGAFVGNVLAGLQHIKAQTGIERVREQCVGLVAGF